jgi:hypothetical protein
MAAHPQISPDTLLDADAPEEPRARLDAFMTAFTRYNLDWEPQLRTALRLSLDRPSNQPSDRPVLRQGRAVGWIEHALEPVRHTHPHVDAHALAVAIRSATGIEALIWLIDIAAQNRHDAAETVRRTAHALLTAALTDTAR